MKPAIIIGIIALVGVGAYHFTQNNTKQPSSSSMDSVVTNVKQINAKEYDQLIEDENTFVVDVHTPEQAHLPGTDAVIAYDQLASQSEALPQDKTTPIILYCRSGSMSREASTTLTQMGYTTVYDLTGGADAYRQQKEGVSLSPNSHDLGTVIYGDVARTTFTLSNFTSEPITITRTSTSCGCTKASVEAEQLEPGESTAVDVSFDPAVHKDDTDLGDITRTIYIETDHPQFPSLETTITATVIKE